MKYKALISVFLLLVNPCLSGGEDAPQAITNSVGMKLVQIPKTGEKGGYRMCSTEVTVGQWWAGMKWAFNHPPKEETKDFPKTGISLIEALRYARILTLKERSEGKIGKSMIYCLPTAEQWEYACMAGSEGSHFFKKELAHKYAVIGRGINDGPMKVGQVFPNKWGLYDMHGNVWEMTVSYFRGEESQKIVNTLDPSCIVKGGCYFSDLEGCSVKRNSFSDIDQKVEETSGFRLILIDESLLKGDFVIRIGEKSRPEK